MARVKQSKGLRLKAKKCRFGLPNIEYVGRVVDKDGLSMSKEKLEMILNFSIHKQIILRTGELFSTVCTYAFHFG